MQKIKDLESLKKFSKLYKDYKILKFEGGDFYTGLFDFSKEHKICRKYIKSVEGDEFRKNDAYCDCRERLDNKKKYGVEKIFD